MSCQIGRHQKKKYSIVVCSVIEPLGRSNAEPLAVSGEG